MSSSVCFPFEQLPLELKLEVVSFLDQATLVSFSMIDLESHSISNNFISINGYEFADECCRLGYTASLKWAFHRGCPLDQASVKTARDSNSSSLIKFLTKLLLKEKDRLIQSICSLSYALGKQRNLKYFLRLLRAPQNLSFEQYLQIFSEYLTGALESKCELRFIEEIENTFLCEVAKSSDRKAALEAFAEKVLSASSTSDRMDVFSKYFSKLTTVRWDVLLKSVIFRRNGLLWCRENLSMDEGFHRYNFYRAIMTYTSIGEIETVQYLLENKRRFITQQTSAFGMLHRALLYAVKSCHVELVDYFSESIVAAGVRDVPDFELVTKFSTAFSPKIKSEFERQFKCFRIVMERFGFFKIFLGTGDETTSYRSTYFEIFQKCILETQNLEILAFCLKNGIRFTATEALNAFLTDLFRHPDLSKFTSHTPTFLHFLESGLLLTERHRTSLSLSNLSEYVMGRALNYGNIDLMEFIIERVGLEHLPAIPEQSLMVFVQLCKSRARDARLPQHRIYKVMKVLFEAKVIAKMPSIAKALGGSEPKYLMEELFG